MNGSDLCAGEHGDGQLRDHGQINSDPIALLDALGLEGIGETVDLAGELVVGDLLDVAHRLANEDVGQLVASPGFGVSVYGIVSNIDLATHKPLGKGGLPLQRLLVGLKPVCIRAGHLIPECDVIKRAPFSHLILSLEAHLLHPGHNIGVLNKITGWII